METTKKYRVLAKVGDDHFVKYSVTNLLKFTLFLDAKFPDWRYFNVFRYTKDDRGEQVASFSKYSRPVRMYI